MTHLMRCLGLWILAVAFVASLLGTCPCGPDAASVPHACCGSEISLRSTEPGCCPAPLPVEIEILPPVEPAAPPAAVATSLSMSPRLRAEGFEATGPGPSYRPIVLRI